MRFLVPLAGVVLLVALSMAWRLAGDDGVAAPGESASEASNATPETPRLASPSAADPGVDPRLQQIADGIRDKYGDRIHQPDWQIKVLTHLMQLLQEMYPDSWRDALATVLRLAFPEQADDLLERLADWLDYEAWLAEVFSEMTFTSAEQRHQALWDKRLSLFGDDAYVIWAQELKQRAFKEAVASLDATPASVSDKAQRYVDLVRETWGDKAFGNHGRHTTQLMGDFVKLESVQTQLRDMPPAQQDRVLTQFRRDMGLDDQAVDRWRELDAERREHRALGSIYMEKRAALVNGLEGEAQQQAIHQLQVELFGEDEARYIRNEEASGVFRFEQPQVIGLN